MIYRITAITPEAGKIEYDTMDESIARRVHSGLMYRQLNENDMTHNVRIEVIK